MGKGHYKHSKALVSNRCVQWRFNSTGDLEILLLRRRSSELYEFPGGKENTPNHIKELLREVREETGQFVKDPKQFKKIASLQRKMSHADDFSNKSFDGETIVTNFYAIPDSQVFGEFSIENEIEADFYPYPEWILLDDLICLPNREVLFNKTTAHLPQNFYKKLKSISARHSQKLKPA